jgi:hypothetical protein
MRRFANDSCKTHIEPIKPQNIEGKTHRANKTTKHRG